MLYVAMVMLGGSTQSTAFHFPRLRTACLQIKVAKRESQIGISILLRSHAQQHKNAKWAHCNGKKIIIEQKILKHC